jgi:hypothetical protein
LVGNTISIFGFYLISSIFIQFITFNFRLRSRTGSMVRKLLLIAAWLQDLVLLCQKRQTIVSELVLFSLILLIVVLLQLLRFFF